MTRRLVTRHVIDGPVLTAYRKARAEGHSPQAAYNIATFQRQRKYPFLEQLTTYNAVTGEVGDFEVWVGAEPDQDSRLGEDDVTGWFTDKHSEGCLRNDSTEQHKLEWYHPSTYDMDVRDGSDAPKGTAKQVAREWAAERIRDAMAADRERTWWTVDVTVRMDGKLLVQRSLCGIDETPDYDVEPYLREAAEELIDEAIDSAERLPQTVRARVLREVERALLAARADNVEPNWADYADAIAAHFAPHRKEVVDRS